MKKYQSYKPSGIEWIGDIPIHWERRKLKWDIFYQEGPGLRTFQFTEDGIRVICVSNITEKGIDFDTTHTRHISESEYLSKYKHFTVQNNDILLSSSGSIGKVCRYFFDGAPVILNTSTIRIHSKNPSRYSSDFVRYVLLSNYIQIQLKFLMTGGIVSNFGPSHLDQLLNYIPALKEQEQIVNYLDEKTSIIDKLISTKERKIELLKEQRTSLINEVITKGLNPNVKMKDSGVEWIGEIPESWSFVRLGVLGSFSKGKGITKDKIKENGFPCIRNGEIYTTYNLRFSEPKSFIDETTISESIKVKKGTLFFTGDGETLEEIGKCVVYLGEEEIYVGGGINIFTPHTDKVSPIYLSYVMSSTSCVYQKSIVGKGEIVVHIYSKQLRDIQFGLPIIQEQQEIVEYLDKHTKEIDDLVSMEQNKIELLKEYRQSLISEVITGKIKVIE